jgi:hypothetical protein
MKSYLAGFVSAIAVAVALYALTAESYPDIEAYAKTNKQGKDRDYYLEQHSRGQFMETELWRIATPVEQEPSTPST